MSSVLTQPAPTLTPAAPAHEALRSRLAHRTKLYLALAALLLPTVTAVLLFTYYPQSSSFKYSLYRWDGQQTEEYRGWLNFRTAWNDKVFWGCFQLTFILLLANLVKMWPSIFTAVVLHRLKSDRWQYVYRVLFVVPMIIPSVVGLLIWKSFYEPGTGVLNKFLNATGLMHLLAWLDTAWPALASTVLPLRHRLIDAPFGSVWGLAMLGLILLVAAPRYKQAWRRIALWALATALAWLVWVNWMGQPVAFAFWTALGFGLGLALPARLGAARGAAALRWIATACFALAALFVLTTMMWPAPTHAFESASPVWLGHTQLVVPALIFWGFPWVGTVGVLIYLAGLQSISVDVYEAAELDGVSSLGRLLRIELPLILTQVRINLVFMTIGTLTDYGLVLLLLGPEGGPGNVGMVPGLYAYRKAFIDNEYGYACALGMVMFVIILVITMVYQKLVKVDK